MQKNYVLLFLLFFTTSVIAQLGSEAWHWQFGQNCSLDFSSGVPVIGSSPVNIWEGTASISDKNTGQLLFYTDGMQVWNKNNVQMPNGFGLMGNGSSTQSALILAKPGSTTLYYVFTSPAFALPNVGVYYSLVDMTLNGGLGDITIKNQLLTAPQVTEKLTAVKYCSGVGYWIIDHLCNSDAFNAYLLTANGIDTVPVISHIGRVIDYNTDGEIGYLRASPNSKRLACGIETDSCLQLFDFNNATGIISNPITITYSLTQGPYGVEFSPDNSKLYASVANSEAPNYNNGAVFQYDLSNYTQSAIINSQTQIIFLSADNGALQLGPDGKIYRADPYTQFIDVINNPNNLGSLCNYQSAAITFPSSAKVLEGLPNFIDESGFAFTTVNVIKDTIACTLNSNYIANATLNNALNYTWYDSTTNPIKTISMSGSYWIDITENNGCIYRDSFSLVISNYPIVNLGNDTILCSPSYLLNITNNNYNYLWNTGDTTQQITIINSGNYWVTATNSFGCKNIDTINVSLYIAPVINIFKDSTECGSAFIPITLNANYPNAASYSWSDGFIGQLHTLTTPGTYWVQYELNNTCISRDSFGVYINPYPTINLGNDTSFCSGTLTLNAYNSSATYIWNNGETTATILASTVGVYWVQVIQNNCVQSDTLKITPYHSTFDFIMPNIVTPNNDGINDFIDFEKFQFSSLQLEIYNRWGNKIFESFNPDCIWKPAEDDGIYFYTLKYNVNCEKSETTELIGYISIVR
jgi:hypothetical protein